MSIILCLPSFLFELAADLKEKLGVHITFINLSGGIGIPYKPDQEPNDIFVIGEGVRKVYEEVLVPADMGDVCNLYRAWQIYAWPLWRTCY